MASPGELQDLRLAVWHLMHHTLGLVLKAEETTFSREAGISHQQFLILMTIESGEPPVTETDISRQLQRNLNSISMILDRMEKQRLVTKQRSTSDRRVVYVQSTAKGRRKLASGIKVGKVLAERLTADFSEAETRSGLKMLERLRLQAMRELGIEEKGKRTSIKRVVETIEKAGVPKTNRQKAVRKKRAIGKKTGNQSEET